ncbi:hypothetical protein [Tessaracoccus sp. Z1128]
MADADLAVALGLALTGRRLDVSTPSALVDELAGLGFDAGALAALRAQRQRAREPWPFAVPLEVRRALGFARFDAALAEAREALGLTGATPAPQGTRPLDRDELRLAADRPPHW